MPPAPGALGTAQKKLPPALANLDILVSGMLAGHRTSVKRYVSEITGVTHDEQSVGYCVHVRTKHVYEQGTSSLKASSNP